MILLIFIILFLLMTYMYFLIATGNYFMKYMFQEMGHHDGCFLLSTRAKPNKMLGDVSFVSKVFYFIHNQHGRILSVLPFLKYVKRFLYYIAFKIEMIPHLSIIIKVMYFVVCFDLIRIVNQSHEWLALCILLIGIMTLIMMPFTSFIGEHEKAYAFDKSLLFHYLIVTDDAVFWTKVIHKKYENNTMFDCKKENKRLQRRQLMDPSGNYIKDRSIFDYNQFKSQDLIKKYESFHPLYMIGESINQWIIPLTKHSGGYSKYNNIEFVKIGKRSYIKSHGMMTIADYQDVISNYLTLRNNTKYEGLNLRRQSQVPAMNEVSAKVLDRTHLIHHRLSGREGGFGTLVPMFKSVNTGTNSVYGGRVQKEPHLKSMKYFEDLAFDHLKKYAHSKVLYFAEPYYKKGDVIPMFVHIQIYHVEKGNVYLIKQGHIHNNPYLFRKDKKYHIDINFKTGQTTITKGKKVL